MIAHTDCSQVTAMIFEIDPSITTPEALRADPVLAEAADKEYALMHSGPRTAISSSVVYLPFSHFVPTETLQKYASTLLSTTPTKLRGRAEILADRITSDQHLGQIEYIFDVAIYSPYFKSVPGKKYATMLQMLQYPFSKGSIHIPSIQRNGHGKRTTAEDKPIIDPKYYEGPGGAVDFECMVRSQSFANKICATAPLSSIIKQRVFPPAPILPESNDDDFSTWVRDTTISEWHPVGTCSMGGRQASDGYVVDARLRVYGTRNLRVCDASVMPLHVSAHIQATVYAIAEKGAALILDDWGKEMGVVG